MIEDVTSPDAALVTIRQSTQELLDGLAAERWTDEDVAAPSLCPGWTRGHVLNHIARNADSITRTLQGALRGEIVARYPGGPAGREADIEAGAYRGAEVLLTDVAQSAHLLDATFAATADANGWDAPTDKDVPAHQWLSQRLVEVEIHRVDLAGAYTADQWPDALLNFLLPHLGSRLGGRTDEGLHVIAEGGAGEWATGDEPRIEVRGPAWAVLAWLVGRPDAAADHLTATPELGGWSYT